MKKIFVYLALFSSIFVLGVSFAYAEDVKPIVNFEIDVTKNEVYTQTIYQDGQFISITDAPERNIIIKPLVSNGSENQSKEAGGRYTTMTCSYKNAIGTCGPFSIDYHYTIDSNLKGIHRRNIGSCYLNNATPASSLRARLSNNMTSKSGNTIKCNIPIKLSMNGYLYGYVSLNSASNGKANLTIGACWSLTERS